METQIRGWKGLNKQYFSSVIRVLVIIVLLIQGSLLYAANRYSRPDGTWSSTNGGATCSCIPGQNDNIFVNHNITIAGPFTLNTGSLTVNSPATLTISGSLTFNNGSSVLISQNSFLHIQGDFLNKNNSNNVTMNGVLNIDGNFTNGTGSGSGAIITFGANAALNIGGICSNPGTVNDTSGVYSGCGQGVLPIELISFVATRTNTSVDLTWSTASEENFDRFVVERTLDGSHFESLGEVRGNGNSIVVLHYSFQDLVPQMGINYYRLKSIDIDGTFEYSEIVAIDFSSVATAMTVYPNPNNGEVIHYSSNFQPAPGDYIVFLDYRGTEVTRAYIDETTKQIVPANLLKQGSYILKYIGSNFSTLKHFIVQ